MIKNYDTQAYI